MGNGQSTEQQSADVYETAQGITRIDTPLERRRIGDMSIDRFAGLKFDEYRQAIEFSKLVAQARHGVPPYLRENPGDCLVVTTQALRWKLEPVWVMQHSYIAKAGSLIAYDAAVHAAIVLSSGLLRERPRYLYHGEGEERRCTVTATFKGETTPLEYTTPPLRQTRPAKNEEGVVKGSPLWTKDVDQALGYFAIRNWGRRHCPEILGGVYDRDEFEHVTQDETPILPPTPNLADRLPGKMAGTTGFQANVVDNGLAAAVAEVEEAKKAARKAPDLPQDAPKPTAPPHPKRIPDEPRTAEEYMAYAAGWIEHGKVGPDDLEARWDGEKELRTQVKLPAGASKRLIGMLRARVNTLRGTSLL